MSTNTPVSGFDFSGFNPDNANAQDIRRSAEIARSIYLGKAFKQVGRRINAAYRSTTELFGYAQRVNQAARL